MQEKLLKVTQPSKNHKLILTLDIDSVYGHMHLDIFKKSFQKPVILNISNSERSFESDTNNIKTNYHMLYDGNSVSLKNCAHAKLGTCPNTDFGPLDIFIVLLNSDKTSQNLHLLVFEYLKSKIDHLNKVKGSYIHAELRNLKYKTNTNQPAENITSNHVKCEDLFVILEPLFKIKLKKLQAYHLF